MIIYAKGYDRDTTRTSEYYPFVIDTKDVLYVRGQDGKGRRCVVLLRHDITENRDQEKYISATTYPMWIVLDMSVEEFYKIWKEVEENEQLKERQ